jgi:hypothetical protein
MGFDSVLWNATHSNNGMCKRYPILSINHVYQNDDLRNLTEAVEQLVFREHMPMGLEYASYPQAIYAFPLLSIYH